MKSLIEQSQAYWDLGMPAEARALAEEALALERDASGGDTTGPAAEWCVVLAYRSGDFASAAERGLREPRFPESSLAIYGIATSLHYLGRHEEAVEVLAPRVRNLSTPNDQYQLACFLSQAGRVDEAVERLFQSLPRYRNDRCKTWLDGDLRRLWSILAEGRFSLATAHRLVEWEFDFLCEWQPGRDETWSLDTTHFKDLPTELRPLFDPVSRLGEYRLLPAATLAAPELVEQFEEWVCDEIAASQRAFDTGRGIALRRVLDAQPHYARAAWERGDLCALRYHVQWAVQNDPARIHDFEHIAGIGPLLDEVRRMLASDAEFFMKLERAALTSVQDTDAALEIIGSLPGEWSGHPLILLHSAHALMQGNRNGDALPLLLRVCSQWPDDPAGFLNAAWAAIKDEMKPGRSEVLKMVRAHAPRAARDYRAWTGMEGWLSWAGDYSPMETFEVKSHLFRGQSDLGGHLAIEIKPSVPMNTAAVQTVMNEARKCAMAMLENGTYIAKELPNVRMDEPVRVAAAELCSQLIGTKHDIFHELHELDQLLAAGAPDEEITSAIALIIRWLRDDIRQMHELVTALDAAAKNDPALGSAYILVAESAVNILNPFNCAAAAADSLQQTVPNEDNPRQ